MKRILINAAQPGEIRIAYVDGNKLSDFEIETPAQENIKGNIYIGVVSAVKSDIESAFVDIGAERHGLLTFHNRTPQSQELSAGDSDNVERLSLDSLKVGQKLLVQVMREARSDKGPALTTEISLPGRFIVLKPNSPQIQTVSRSVSESTRIRLKEIGNQLPKVENTGWIIRTTSMHHDQEDVTGDFHRMLNLWRNIQGAVNDELKKEAEAQSPVLVYSDNTFMQRVLRDRLRSDGTTVIVDDPKLYRDARSFASDFMPELRDKIELYRGTRPIFESFRVESDVRSIFKRDVKLPSGGEVVFDPTEALLAIDVNSARHSGSENLEETALRTNLEAAQEICRQLLIRSIGGLVVVDFIDMNVEGYNEQVEEVVEQCLRRDPAQTSFTMISELGLMEINRQRIRSSIYDTHFTECEHCLGARYLLRTETTGSMVLRNLSYMLHDPNRTENQFLCRASSDVAAYVLNKERQFLRDLEMNTHKQVFIIADPTVAPDRFYIQPRRVPSLDYEEGSNIEELVTESATETKSRQRVPLPEEPKEIPQPLVTNLGRDTKQKKSKSKSGAKPQSKNRNKKRSKAKQAPKGMFQKILDKLSLSSSSKSQKSKKTGSKSGDKSKGQKQARTSDARRQGGRRSDGNRRRTPQKAPQPTTVPTRSEPQRTTSNTRSGSPRSGQSRGDQSQARQVTSRRSGDSRGSQSRNRAQPEDDASNAQPNRRMPKANRMQGSRRDSNAQDDRPRQSSASDNRPPRERSRSQSTSQGEPNQRRQQGRQQSRQGERSRRPRQQPRAEQQNRHAERQPTGRQSTDSQQQRGTVAVDEIEQSQAQQEPLLTTTIQDETKERVRAPRSSRFAGNDPRSANAEAKSSQDLVDDLKENKRVEREPQRTESVQEERVSDSAFSEAAPESNQVKTADDSPKESSAPPKNTQSSVNDSDSSSSEGVSAVDESQSASPSRAGNDPRKR